MPGRFRRDVTPLNLIGRRKLGREDLGDVAGLAESMRANGLLHPPVIAKDGTLICGERRVAAARLLGWTEIEISQALDAESEGTAIRMQYAENADRKDLTPSEAVAVARRLLPAERERALARQAASQAKPGEGKVGGAESAEPTGDARDRVADAVGMGRTQLAKAAAVADAAAEDPGRFKEVRDRMDATGNVEAAHRELKARGGAGRGRASRSSARPTRQGRRRHWRSRRFARASRTWPRGCAICGGWTAWARWTRRRSRR